MKPLLIVLGSLPGLALAPAAGWAQLVSNPKPALQSRDPILDLRENPHHPARLSPLLALADNAAVLSQRGNRNEAFIAQIGEDNFARLAITGNGNTTAVTQLGNNNLFDLTLTGNNNPVSVQQLGNNNVYDMDLNATNTPVSLVQNGSGNRVNNNLAGSNRAYNIGQFGNNNLLNQVEGNASMLQQGYSVQMRGNGIRMTISQGQVAR